MRVLIATILQKSVSKGTFVQELQEGISLSWMGEIASHRKVKNFDIIKFKGMYHINDIEKFRDFT